MFSVRTSNQQDAAYRIRHGNYVQANNARITRVDDVDCAPFEVKLDDAMDARDHSVVDEDLAAQHAATRPRNLCHVSTLREKEALLDNSLLPTRSRKSEKHQLLRERD